MRGYTSMEKGKNKVMTTHDQELVMNPEYIWQGSYTGLMMEQIRNSQEDNMLAMIYQVRNYIHLSY